MAVETLATDATFTGTGVSSTYSPEFYVNSSDQVKVYVDGVLQTIGDDYVVNNVGTAAGCDIVGNFTLGSVVYVERVTPITQLVDTLNNETILEDVLDAEFDKLTMIAQEIDGKASRAILLPKGESGYTLPAAEFRAGLFLGFDPITGAPLPVEGTGATDLAMALFLQAGAGAVPRTARDKMRDAVHPKDFGAVGDGVTNDAAALNAALTYAFSAGKAVDGGDLLYAVSGGLSYTGLTSPWISSLRLKQMNAAFGGATLLFLNCTGVQIDKLFVDCGTYNTAGDANSSFGLKIENGIGHRVENVEITGKGKRSYFSAWFTERSIYRNITVRDCDYNDPAATDDVLQGIWLYGNVDCSLVSPRVWNLYGNSTAVPGFTHLYTRGIAMGGNTRVSVVDAHVRDVDQGCDISGGPAINYACTVLGGHFYQCTQVGVKLANSAVACKVIGVIAERCGTFCFGASGPSENDGGNWTRQIDFIGCTAIDPGYNDFPTYSRGFNCIKGAWNANYPSGVRFINCRAISTDAKMDVAYFNDVPFASDSPTKFVQCINCEAEGYNTAFQQGMTRVYCHVTATGTAQSLAHNTQAAIAWPNETEDTTAMHSTSSSTDEILLRLKGTYRVRGELHFAASSNGYRRANITINGTSIGIMPFATVSGELTVCPFDRVFTTTAANSILKLLGEQTSGGAVAVGAQSWAIIEQLDIT